MTAFYNEHDPKAAAWLRELIKQGHIAPGVVDERSIIDLTPKDLDGYTQCHFFAGIGVWSYALRCAGWPDDRPVWTGSCPCQPFSAAGKGDEFADERHLWPAWFRLIRECKPDAIFGEQVASKDALAWFDHVSTDLEGEGYAVGAVDTPASGYGAPHIRQRLYFVADSGSERRQQISRGAPCDEAAHGRTGRDWGEPNGNHVAASSLTTGDMGNPPGRGFGIERDAPQPQRSGHADGAEFAEFMGDTIKPGLEGHGRHVGNGHEPGWHGAHEIGSTATPGPTAGFWRDAEWLACRDGKARPVEPGTSPLAHGSPARVGRLRGYGNAIVAPQAEEFVKAFMECAA